MRDHGGDSADGGQALSLGELMMQAVKLRLGLGKLGRQRGFEINR
jgi:hypothetical protein